MVFYCAMLIIYNSVVFFCIKNTLIEITHVELDISAPSATSMDGAMLDQPVMGNALDHGEGG